jgi:hypothetical protein
MTTPTLVIDRYSYESAVASGSNLSGVGEVRIVDRAGTFTYPENIEVTVPEIGGSGVVFIDVPMTGTSLEGIDVPDIILVNPTDDDTSELLVNARVSGLDEVRLAVRGPAAGGPFIFRFSRGYSTSST